LNRVVTHADESGRDPGDYRVGGNVCRDDSSGRNDGALTDTDAFQNDGAAANPHLVLYHDRAIVLALARDLVQVRIHDDNVPGDLAVTANLYGLLCDDQSVVIQVGAIADADDRSRSKLEAHALVKLAVFGLESSAAV
jgi:hypothetical protein